MKIRDSLQATPCTHSEQFTTLTGNRIQLKLENLHMTGSFKERGALHKVLSLTPEERERGVIAASAGNHAQGLAYHATRQGIRSKICMPVSAPITKVQATKRYGGEVVLHGNSFDEAGEEAQRLCKEEGLTFVHAFNDEAIIAGQGTCGLELLEQAVYQEIVVCPVGGGGLIGGTACALKEINPRIRVIGVQTARVPSMKVALAEHHPVTVPAAQTIGDGIAVRRAGDLTLPLVEKYVDDILTVDEEEIANAILLLLEREKMIAEGAGAAGLAAVLNDKLCCTGKKITVVISGGNIDVNFLSRIIERGLVKDGRLVRLRLRVPDSAGSLHGITGILAKLRGNVIEVAHDRAYFGTSLGDTTIDITLETRGPEHIAEIAQALTASGYTHERIL